MERSACRIIDANFNRAREAARVVEDYCRFALNSQPLSNRAKGLRHALSAIIAKLDAAYLISSRDTPGDVGLGQVAPSALGRANLTDALAAACKRLPEALRVLAEVIRPTSHPIAEQIERLRYDSYILEKDVALFANAQERFARVRLYVIISSNLPADVFALAGRCISGGADCLQLRAKNIDDDKYFATAGEFVKICKDSGALSIINDRADIAVASGADGVHIGQHDLPVEEARKLQITPLIIGRSTHSLPQLTAAIAQLPAYASLGPVFATTTKPGAKPVGTGYVTEGVRLLAGSGVGHVAVGGISIDNLDVVLRAGAEAVAVCSAVADSPDPAAACKMLKDKLNASRPM